MQILSGSTNFLLKKKTKNFCMHVNCIKIVPATQLVKNLPAVQETPVWFLGQEVPLEKG